MPQISVQDQQQSKTAMRVRKESRLSSEHNHIVYQYAQHEYAPNVSFNDLKQKKIKVPEIKIDAESRHQRSSLASSEFYFNDEII